jgi:hypothetical protein
MLPVTTTAKAKEMIFYSLEYPLKECLTPSKECLTPLKEYFTSLKRAFSGIDSRLYCLLTRLNAKKSISRNDPIYFLKTTNFL